MALSLEERIKQLMEGKSDSGLSEATIQQLDEKETIKTKGGTTIVDDEKDSKDDDSEDEDKDGDDDSEDSDEDTDLEKDAGPDAGKKNAIKVNEDKDPFGKLDSNGGDSAGDAGKNAKLKVGQGRKEDPRVNGGKLTDTATADKSDDNGDNARLKAKQGDKDDAGQGKLTGPAAGGSENPDNARNNVVTQKMSEHIDALMNGEELSEEFRSKATTIFEAAVEQVAASRVATLEEEYAQEIVKLQEEQQSQLVEAVEEVKSELIEQIDGFLNYVVEQWVGDNQIALQGGMKVELVNGFIDGLKDLFKEHYVDIPEDKLDLIEEQSEEIVALSQTAEKLAEERLTLEKELQSLKSQLVFEDVASDLTDVQKEKFKELAESVVFTSNEEYTDKLSTLKENYFPVGKEQVAQTKKVEVIQEENSNINVYAAALANKTLRF